MSFETRKEKKEKKKDAESDLYLDEQFIQASATYEKGVITSAEEVIFSVGFVCLSACSTVSRITHAKKKKKKK